MTFSMASVQLVAVADSLIQEVRLGWCWGEHVDHPAERVPNAMLNIVERIRSRHCTLTSSDRASFYLWYRRVICWIVLSLLLSY